MALYDAWLEPMVESALANDGSLDQLHAGMLEQRRREGNRALWAAAGGLNEPARAFLARLLRIEDALHSLRVDR